VIFPRTKLARRFLSVVVSIILIFLVAAWWIFYSPNPSRDDQAGTIYVSRGQSFPEIADSLSLKGIIRSRGTFYFVARVLGGSEHIRTGKYVIPAGTSNTKLFLMLRSGKGNQLIQVPIPEGSRVRMQAHLFSRNLGIDSAKYTEYAFDPDFAGSLGVQEGSLEGYLLPDTYEFSWEQDEREILRYQVASFWKFFDDSMKARCESLGFTIHQAVTLASIVEGEAVLGEERPIIAGVYLNRLKRRMKLEADPTIQYIIGETPRRILYDDLKIDNPYNTYRYPGLPPGPVNNPGKASLVASLHPASHDYLFFVANGKGGHWFARTFADHRHYVRIYKKQRARALTSGNVAKG
jgi:UPF0755 protein